MKDPQISWHVLQEETLTPYEEYYAGSLHPNETLEVVIQVWNNKWGQDKAADVENSKIAIFFDTIEDSYLLNLCSVKIDNDDFESLTIQSNRGRIDLGKTLSGEVNTGSISSKNNYADITLRFGPITNGMKNSLKNLYVDLEFDK